MTVERSRASARRVAWAALACALAAGGCKKQDERQGCRTSAECPAGESCQLDGGGLVCLADLVPPDVSPVTVTCSTQPCYRDSSITVSATVVDDIELASVYAILTVRQGQPGAPVRMTRTTGDVFAATIPLASIPFPEFLGQVITTVAATDGAQQLTTRVAGPGQQPSATRLRWVHTAGAPLSAPALLPDGTVVVSRDEQADQLWAVRPTGTKAWSISLGFAEVTEPPAVGAQAIWVGDAAGDLRGVALDGSDILPRECDAGGALVGPPAVVSQGGSDTVFAASAAGRVIALGPSGCVLGPVPDPAEYPAPNPFTTGVLLESPASLWAVSTHAGASTARHYGFAGGAFEELLPAAAGDAVTAPLAFDGTDLWWGGGDGLVRSTGSATAVAALAGPITASPLVLAGGDVVVGDGTTLRRFTAGGTELWSVTLTSRPVTPVALRGGDAALLVPTEDGRLYAFRENGSQLWSFQLATLPLRAPTVFTPPGGGTSVAYVSSANGNVYAIQVDGALDPAAPWPKAWRDVANTSFAGAAP